MNRRSLGVTAIVLIVLMGIVATAGLDNLPRQLRQSVAAAGTRLTADRATFDQNRDFIVRAVHDDPALFQTKAAQWQDRLNADRSRLDSAAAKLAILQQLSSANRRTDAEKVQQTLADFESLRQPPVKDVADVRADTQRWLDYKRQLPDRVAAMHARYDAIKSFDIDAAAVPARKAMLDWPAKKDDLQARIDALVKLQAGGEKIWETSAPLRAAAESNNLANFDYANFFDSADVLDATARQLRDGSAAINALAGQLYVSWDKLLNNVERQNGYREKVRFVRTRFPDATLTHGETTSEDRWEDIDAAQYRAAEHSVGMVVERKPPGKYDSEAERAVQPPAYAYVAPPGQANAYGSWTGGVWHWLPEYLILSQLLHASRGPVTTPDYEAYQMARRRGEVFYGRNDEYRPRLSDRRGSGPIIFGRSAPSTSSPSTGGPAGGWYKERPKPSFGDRGYSSSTYQSRGTFSGSRYQSRGTFRPGGGGSFGMRSYSRGMGGMIRGGRR